mmetsp:Transcript_29419/g.49427  ORF Transcript_29419/g.49427 Transcript_29419/m.49427 type:complete len:461 (-) Transcript_29419:136-1518(-)|eukprot:CAMPEP_0198208146 /NCGR_PEP_ID=MMETSP1445-20131203/11538_1 /TAXON_ID=36898 /ORGANISM="Pyramimonas sp., Strain CCMP2087" /LENGTH=460 /DNA_ID=CAMNT_0043881431 /DNA_START=264 /DNA_END=1646 /DNA_ORIENTATION=+
MEKLIRLAAPSPRVPPVVIPLSSHRTPVSSRSCQGIRVGSFREQRTWLSTASALVRRQRKEAPRRRHVAVTLASSFDLSNWPNRPEDGPEASVRRVRRDTDQSRRVSALERRRFLAQPKRGSAFPLEAVNDGKSGQPDSSGVPDNRENIFRMLWERVLRPLRDFGFGRKNIWEGGVGLFLIGGFAILGCLFGWVQGFALRNRAQAYRAVIEFPLASGITVGTPVRVRGVTVGNVLSVKPTIAKVDVLVEVNDSAIAIPRNSMIEANQTGLVAETMIDITPQDPIPTFQYGPLDSQCKEEGVVLCNRDRIKGETGYSLDQLVAVMTKLAREVDKHGLEKTLVLGDRMGDMLTEARPLIDQALKLSQELLPVLRQVKDRNMVATMERLTETALSTAADLKRLESAILTDENTELLRQSVATLTKTLQHVESISGDIGSVTGDPKTKHNLRNLIQALSRLVDA